MELLDFSTSVWSILPALLALGLAILTRKVLFSLSIGIIVGAFMLADGVFISNSENSGFGGALGYLVDRISSLIYTVEDGNIVFNDGNIHIVLFLLLLGILTALLSVSGSNQAFANWAQKRIKGRRGAKIMAACLVFITFIDDYFHSLAVGAIARPVTDKFKVSRAKLAYILDSTAAPMCVMMPVSSWGAYIMTLVAGLLAEHAITGYTPFSAFMQMSALNFYAIFSMVMVFAVAYFTIDIGPMARLEKLALEQSLQEEASSQSEGHVRNLILPILALILGTVTMMIYTGNQDLAADGKSFSVLGAFENTTVGISLVVGGVSAIIVSTLLILFTCKVSLGEYAKSYWVGARSMFTAIAILFFAWTINKVVGDMQTGKYLSSLITGNLDAAYLPCLLFLLGSAMAFSTGTSWGTFGIMLPIAASIAVHAAPDLLFPCLSAVMAGAVCGDHCSPVSDTTILSSTGAKCNHIDHVTTQLPYAFIVATASAIGYLVLGFTDSGLAGFVTTAVILAVAIFLTNKREKIVN